jgi:hypothetical protein
MSKRTGALAAAVFALGLTLGLVTAAWTAERHPEIRAAQRDLARAKGHLKAAAHDFGGHRVKAIEFIDRAQGELREALEYDRK